jgi:N6-adenosine-specific RNA methylase IME4
LTPSEIEALRRRCEALLKEQAKERQREHGGTAPGKHSGKVSRSDDGRARDKIGAFAGISGRTVEKIAAVCAAAEREPDRFGHLVEEMDRSRRVTTAHRKLCIMRDEERILGLVPVAGKVKTLAVDPPWRYGQNIGDRQPPYATMTQEELLALPVAAWAEDNCHLYLWTTNAFIPAAVELMARWGFELKTVITWIKPRWGLGNYFRNSTEHVLFGVRGRLGTRSDSIPTHFEAPTGTHSEKPERFYEIVRAASYPPYGEAFQRTARPDFINLFAKREAAE